MTTTDRLTLPLLAAAQAQKEMTHNEALTLLDAVCQPVVAAVAPATVPTAPAPGTCWIVGNGATGAWAGHDGALAMWTAGGWRFVAAFDGMTVWCVATATIVRRTGGNWTSGPVIAAPVGGTTVDAEGRAAISAVLLTLRAQGLIAD